MSSKNEHPPSLQIMKDTNVIILQWTSISSQCSLNSSYYEENQCHHITKDTDFIILRRTLMSSNHEGRQCHHKEH